MAGVTLAGAVVALLEEPPAEPLAEPLEEPWLAVLAGGATVVGVMSGGALGYP